MKVLGVRRVSGFVGAVLCAAILHVAPDAWAQQVRVPEHETSRTPAGEPDLRGIWEVRGTVDWNIEGHPATKAVAASRTVIVDPPDGKIPYKPEARAKRAKMNPADDPDNKCYMTGVPRSTYAPGPFQIFQTAGLVVIVYQRIHNFRYIPTTPWPPIDALELWMGSSQGRWEGDALVVESTSFNDQTWFDHAGNFHSPDLRVIEKYRLNGPNTLLYEATIEDPNVFTRPWTMRITAERHTEPGFRILEDECLPDGKGGLLHTVSTK